MIQFSVYARPCVTFARQETHLRRIRLAVPKEGAIRAIYITKAQWEKAFIIHGKPAVEAPRRKCRSKYNCGDFLRLRENAVNSLKMRSEG